MISLYEEKRAIVLELINSATAGLDESDVVKLELGTAAAAVDAAAAAAAAAPVAVAPVDPIQKFLPSIALLVEESPLPLSALSTACFSHLKQLDVNNELAESLSEEAVSKQILIIAERKLYTSKTKATDNNNDTTENSIFRFEIVPTLIPSFFTKPKAAILAARAQRRKASTYLKAVERVLGVLAKGVIFSTKVSERSGGGC